MKKCFYAILLLCCFALAHEAPLTKEGFFDLKLGSSSLQDIKARFKHCKLIKKSENMPTDIKDESVTMYIANDSCKVSIPEKNPLIIFSKPFFMIDNKTGKLVKMQFRYEGTNELHKQQAHDDFKENHATNLLLYALSAKYGFVPNNFKDAKGFCNEKSSVNVVVETNTHVISFQLTSLFYNQVNVKDVCDFYNKNTKDIREKL